MCAARSARGEAPPRRSRGTEWLPHTSPSLLLRQISTVGAYIHYGAGAAMSDPRAVDLSRVKRGKTVGDPLYAIVSTKQ